MTPDSTTRALSGWVGIAALVELLVLRTGTRTLIHIPGLGRFDTLIGAFGELGRLAYYLSLVLVVATLLYVGFGCWATRTTAGRLTACLAWSFILVALMGRLGVVTENVVTWVSLVVMLGVLTATWNGARSVPVAFFTAAWMLAAWSVLGQGAGGGLSGQAVDVLVIVAEGLFLLTGVSSPLLVRGRTTRGALVAGLVGAVVVTTAFSLGGSTLAILSLWNLGLPAWFAPIALGIALGSLTFTFWSAIANHQTLTGSAVLLMLAGGVGPISTYQTALAITAVILVGVSSGSWGRLQPSDQSEPRAGGLTVVRADTVTS